MATIDVTPTQRRLGRLPRRVATLFVLSAAALCALALADSAWASGSDPSSDPLAGVPDAAAAAAQATPAATPSEPQDPASAAESGIQAATQQAATAVANANQNAQNIVVIIRINSPGDDVVNQSNTAIANAVAANNSSTNQGSGAGSVDDTGSGPVDDAGQPVGSNGTTPSGTADAPAASSTPPTTMPATAAAPPAATPTAVTTAPAAPRSAAPGSERARPRAFAAVRRPSGGGPHASDKAAVAKHSAASPTQSQAGANPGHQVAPREAATAVPHSASAAPRADERRTSVTWAPARAHRAAARAGAGAAHLISSFTHPPTLPSVPASKADQVSTAVVLTLLAVLLAILLGVGSTYVPAVRTWAER